MSYSADQISIVCLLFCENNRNIFLRLNMRGQQVAGSDQKKIREGFVGQRMITLTPDIKRAMLKNELINSMFVTAIGFYPNAIYHDRERKTGSNEYILLYCIKGEGTVTLNGKTVRLRPHTFFIIPKHVAHHYKSSVQDPWSILWVHFTGAHAEILYARYLESFGHNEHFIPYAESLNQLFNETLTIMERSFRMRDIEIANIKFFAFISSLIYHKDIHPHVQEDDVVSHSIQFMKANLDNLFSVEELAGQQHCSTSHYYRLFHQQTGTSPIQYFNQLKIHKSCQYLYFTDKSVKEICLELGFNDPYYFSRIFRKFMGISPMKYRSRK
jgi:AraC family transcriptional regulator of arabinose operon